MSATPGSDHQSVAPTAVDLPAAEVWQPTLGDALRRNAWTGLGVLSVVPVIGGLVGSAATLVAVVTILVGITRDPQRRGWHDRLAAGTRVADVG
jgi:hypothetical protein